VESQPGKLRQLFEYNFLEYTSYVIKERAIPDINDGLKPVQRRILQTLHNMDDGRFHKVANVVGATMKLHPHGDQSIFAALVNLANKGFLIERQGELRQYLYWRFSVCPSLYRMSFVATCQRDHVQQGSYRICRFL